ncbi:MAG: hypothetical protein JSS69_05445 [Acidobacteria bacterium]|nr:hypothetical protein [Acidobacteriota bacterium]MBS1865345.1 hypothetical protein [Acidobacteriota bacterium]
MTKRKHLLILSSLAFLLVPIVQAQDEPKHETTQHREKEVTPLRVQVLFIEFEGEKKISNLPYTLLVNADEKGPRAALRMGLRVPIVTGTGGDNRQYTYLDVGTNLDGFATRNDDGRFSLQLNVERSTIYGPNSDQKGSAYEGARLSGETPVILSFRSQVNLVMRDGQTMQSTVATDPLTGRILKVEITVNVIK